MFMKRSRRLWPSHGVCGWCSRGSLRWIYPSGIGIEVHLGLSLLHSFPPQLLWGYDLIKMYSPERRLGSLASNDQRTGTATIEAMTIEHNDHVSRNEHTENHDGADPSSIPHSSTPNSDILTWPAPTTASSPQKPLSPQEQLLQLNHYFEDHYPEVFLSLTTDEAQEYRDSGQPVPAEIVAHAERQLARTADLMSHASLLVLGSGLDHTMPHVAFLREGHVRVEELAYAAELPAGVRATVIRSTRALSAETAETWAISLHGGPGWFGDGLSHDQFWLPLFASIAGASGINIIDVTYPLPGYGTWEPTQEAVAETRHVIRSHLPDDAALGSIVFGSGLIAGAEVLSQSDFIVAMTPRIPETNPPRIVGTQIPLLVSLADSDTRGTPENIVHAWAQEHRNAGGVADVQSWPSEHIIAAPAVWRERIGAIGQWINQLR